DPRPALGPSQFAQYQLDRASTIAEVIASEKEIRPFSALVKMHFLVCEKSGDCAVIQFIDGKMNVYRGKDLPFPGITNSPYPDSIAAALACKGGECELADKSLWRFAEINRLKSTLENSKELTTQAYQALDHVAQDAGTVTRFQMVYDSGNSVFHVRKHGASAFGTLKVDFNDPAFGAQPMYIPVTAQTSGDLAHSWQALTAEKQAAMSAHMGYPEKLAKIVGDYPFLKTSPKLPGACPTEFNRLLPNTLGK
ncbi:MAG: hypothetical protein ACXVBE_14240, partial [Bdellovibrionota bacterium]